MSRIADQNHSEGMESRTIERTENETKGKKPNQEIYSNSFSKEVLPGLIKPLVWSVNVPLVNGAWIRFIRSLTGIKDLRPEDLAKQYYYRAYFNMSALGRVWERLGMPQDSLERLTGSGAKAGEGFKIKPSPKMMSSAPFMFFFLMRHVFIADRVEKELPRYKSKFKSMAGEDLTPLTEEELLARVDRLTIELEDPVYFNVIIPLTSNLFRRMLESRLTKLGIDPSKVDLIGGPEFSRFYPNEALVSLHKVLKEMDWEVRSRIEKMGIGALIDDPDAERFRNLFQSFMDEFGHLSESGNDFSIRPWRENPDLVLNLIVHLNEKPFQSGCQRIEQLDIPKRQRGKILSLAKKARRMSALREQVSSTYSYGYGLYRKYFLELGARLAQRQLINAPDDVFYLNLDELRQIVSGGCSGNTCNNYKLRVMLRKKEMEEMKDILVPPVIHGHTAPPLVKIQSEWLTGTAASGGLYKGKARVIRGPGEISKLSKGEVMIIPYSDVSWTPLFAKAGAVVSESGGILSHTSIVAREYGIPAVVSVEGAMNIPDGSEVIVDGDQGKIYIKINGSNEMNV